MALPDQLRPYFPSYELADLDCGADKKLIITSLLNFGDTAALRWLFSMYVLSDITDAVQHPLRGSWTLRALNFWRIIFDLDLDKATMARALAEPTPRPDSYQPLFD